MRSSQRSTRPSLAQRARQVAVWWGPVLVWMGIVFALSAQSSLPNAPDDFLDVIVKKLAHTTEYAILAVLVTRALARGRRPRWRDGVLALAVALVFATSDEIHQSLVPNRHPSPVDVAIDLAGAALGVAIFGMPRRNDSEDAGN